MRAASRTAAWKESACRSPIGEEEERERLRGCVVLAHEQVGDEGLRDEAAAEAVERKESRQSQHDPARAVERRSWLRLELLAPLDRGRECSRSEQTRRRCERVDEQPLR